MADTAVGNVAIARLIEEQNRRLDKRDDALDARLIGIETAQKETNVHLATMNGAVAELRRRTNSHSTKLDDRNGEIAQFMARLAVVESVTEVRDKYQEQGIRNASGDAWAAQQTASDVRTEAVGWFREIRQAAISAVLVVALLLAVLALAGVFG